MYHPRFSGTHYEMGRKMGSIFKKHKVRFPIALDAFQTGFGGKSGALLKRFFPDAAEEIKGITDVTGYDNELFTSWMMCMGCCLYNLTETQSIEVRGCTAFSFTHKGRVYYARNNDLPLFFKKAGKSVYYRPEHKTGFILNTSSFVNGEEGINGYGLAAAMTFVLPKLDEIQPGLNSVFLVRYILEKCISVEEGIKALYGLPIASSCNILLADKSGSMAVAECNPLETHVRYPEKNKNGEHFIVTVNHFTSEKMRKHDASDHNAYFSGTRYHTAYHALEKTDYINGIEHARNILGGKYGFMCQYDKAMNFATVWSSIFDISGNTIYRAEGNPQKTKYREDTRLSAHMGKNRRH